jgi:hypothetical protein
VPRWNFAELLTDSDVRELDGRGSQPGELREGLEGDYGTNGGSIYEAGGDTTDWLRIADRSSGWRAGFAGISGSAFGCGGMNRKGESDGCAGSAYEGAC